MLAISVLAASPVVVISLPPPPVRLLPYQLLQWLLRPLLYANHQPAPPPQYSPLPLQLLLLPQLVVVTQLVLGLGLGPLVAVATPGWAKQVAWACWLCCCCCCCCCCLSL